MTFTELRAKHPRFVYESFVTEQTSGTLTMRFSLRLEPDIVFHPTLSIPIETKIDQSIIDLFAFHLGMVECISYWKAACPAELIVKAGNLNEEQIAWWKDLFLNGLGEFFYKNNIDFTRKGFFRIVSGASEGSHFAHSVKVQTSSSPSSAGAKAVTEFENARLPAPSSRDLVLVSGGKDSAVTLELLKKSGRPSQPLVLNPTRAALDNIRIAGFTNPLIARRTIDPKLLELNHAGYLNGHTPFSAYLAFLGITVAVLGGFENVIVSNEASASEGNVTYRGVEINHQYSKSFQFEKKFREYARTYLTDKHSYFSLLRPLNELQISKLFSRFPQYFSSFRSCNMGLKTDSWCGRCAKCAFVYLSLSPFVSEDQMMKIFGANFLKKPEIMKIIEEMRKGRKPFECVGTKEEVELALAKKTKFSFWNLHHFVPKAYEKLLKMYE